MTSVISWGAKRGPGVGVEEILGNRQIVGAPVGRAALLGLLARGPVDELIRIRTREQLALYCGHDLFNSFSGAFDGYVPDAARAFFDQSKGAAELLLVRLEGADAVKAAVTFPTRRPVADGGGDCLKLEAANAGRWGGRHQAATLTGLITAVANDGITMGAASYVTDEWAGATVTNATVGASYVVQSNDGTKLSAPSDYTLIADGWVVGDTVTVNLPHDDRHLAAEIEAADNGLAGEFKLTLYIDGEPSMVWPRLTMDPTSQRYAIKVINNDPRNRMPGSDTVALVTATDSWLAGGGSYASDTNPANIRGTSTALTATVCTDAGASFPTTAVEGYDLAGHWLVDPDDRTVRAKIASNTSTAITVLSTYDLTTLFGANPQDYEVVAPIRAAGGKNDHSGVASGNYIAQLTDGTSAFDAVEEEGFGTVAVGVPGLSAFAAADRYAINIAGISYAQTRAWEWQIETAATLTAVGGAGQGISELETIRDFLFGSSANQLNLDTIWASAWVVSWGLVNYTDHGTQLVVPTMGDRLGLEAYQAARTGGYVDPGAGIEAGYLQRFAQIDLDRATSTRRMLERFSDLGMNFLIRRPDGRVYVWGARLPQRTQDQWTFRTHRRQMSHYALTFAESEALARAVLRPITPQLRARVKGALDSYLRGEYEAGRLDQEVPFEEAAVTNVSREINPASQTATGLLVAEVVVKLPDLAERVRVRLSKAGVEVSIAS